MKRDTDILGVLVPALVSATILLGGAQIINRSIPLKLAIVLLAAWTALSLYAKDHGYIHEFRAMVFTVFAIGAAEFRLALLVNPDWRITVRPGMLLIALLFTLPAADIWRKKTGIVNIWQWTISASGALVLLGLIAGYLLLGKYHSLDASVFAGSARNVLLVVASYTGFRAHRRPNATRISEKMVLAGLIILIIVGLVQEGS